MDRGFSTYVLNNLILLDIIICKHSNFPTHEVYCHIRVRLSSTFNNRFCSQIVDIALASHLSSSSISQNKKPKHKFLTKRFERVVPTTTFVLYMFSACCFGVLPFSRYLQPRASNGRTVTCVVQNFSRKVQKPSNNMNLQKLT